MTINTEMLEAIGEAVAEFTEERDVEVSGRVRIVLTLDVELSDVSATAEVQPYTARDFGDSAGRRLVEIVEDDDLVQDQLMDGNGGRRPMENALSEYVSEEAANTYSLNRLLAANDFEVIDLMVYSSEVSHIDLV